MNFFQSVRIVLLLILIFVAGIFTGRFTAPKTQYIVMGPSGRPMTADTVLANFKRQLTLTPKEEADLYKILLQLDKDLAAYPPLSDERLAIFKRYYPRLRATVSTNQHVAFDALEKDIERRFEMKRRASPNR